MKIKKQKNNLQLSLTRILFTIEHKNPIHTINEDWGHQRVQRVSVQSICFTSVITMFTSAQVNWSKAEENQFDLNGVNLQRDYNEYLII